MSAAIYQIVTDRIVELLEKGVVPWQKPWRGIPGAPRNLVSGKPYRGVNSLLLHAAGHASPYWVTFRQAQALGGHVRRAEKGLPVVFWRWLDVENKETGEKEQVPLLRYYTVFNVAQCEGLTVPAADQPIRDHSPLQVAEQIVAGMPKCPRIEYGRSRACYSPVTDLVKMPAAERFTTAESFYSVLFHELTHSTGHESRLNRKAVSRSGGERPEFGSDPYAQEELVAELGAAFLCAQAGIVERTVENSAAYVAGWLETLKNDTKLVVQAAAQAQKAADWILGDTETLALAE